MQSLAEDKEGENPFYMHNSAYTRTDAFYEAVSADYTAYEAPTPLNPRGLDIPVEHELNLKLIIPLAVIGGLVLIGGIVAIIIIVLKKKKI